MYASGAYGGGLFPRVGPFAPPSQGAYFAGGALGTGAGIYGGGGGGGHPYLRAMAAGGGAGGASPLLGLASRWGGAPLSASGPLGGAAAFGADAASGGLGSNAIALAQAYQTRMAALSSVAASLLSKREAAVHQLARVQARLGEVTAAREAVEAETLADAEAVLHRLRAAEAAKFAGLQKDAEALVADIAATDGFYGALTSFQPQAGAGEAGGAAAALGGLYDPAVALQFMRAYPELCAEADRLSAKTIKAEVDVAADDFEREVANRNELAGRYAALTDLVAAKDRIILQLLKVRGGRKGARAGGRACRQAEGTRSTPSPPSPTQEREATARDRDAFRSGVERAAAGRTASTERRKTEEVEHWVGCVGGRGGTGKRGARGVARAAVAARPHFPPSLTGSRTASQTSSTT